MKFSHDLQFLHISHTTIFNPKIVTKCNVISYVCMCVLKTQTLLPSLLNDIRINLNMRTSEMNQEKMKRVSRVAFIYAAC